MCRTRRQVTTAFHDEHCRGRSRNCASRTNVRRGVTVTELLLVILSAALLWVGIGELCRVGLTDHLQGATSSTHYHDLSPLTGVAISPNQRDAVVVGVNGTLRVHDIRSGQCTGEGASQYSESRTVCWAPDGKWMLVGSGRGFVELWSLGRDTRTSRVIKAHDFSVTCCRFSPDGSYFVTAGDDLRCIIWKTETLLPVLELPSQANGIRSLEFTAEGKYLLAGDVSGVVKVWDWMNSALIRSWSVVNPVELYRSYIEGLVVLPDQASVLIAARNGEMSLWDLRTGTRRQTLRKQGRDLYSLSASKDGCLAMVGGKDGQIEVWDVTRGTFIKTLGTHSGPVKSVAYSDSLSTVVSTGCDGEVKFWSVETSSDAG